MSEITGVFEEVFLLNPTGVEQVVLDRYRELEGNETAVKSQIDMFRSTLEEETLGAAVSIGVRGDVSQGRGGSRI